MLAYVVFPNVFLCSVSRYRYNVIVMDTAVMTTGISIQLRAIRCRIGSESDIACLSADDRRHLPRVFVSEKLSPRSTYTMLVSK